MNRARLVLIAVVFWLLMFLAGMLWGLLTGQPVEWRDTVDGGAYVPRDELLQMNGG